MQKECSVRVTNNLLSIDTELAVEIHDTKGKDMPVLFIGLSPGPS